MGKLRFGRVFDSLCLSSGSSCFCGINSFGSGQDGDHFEKRPLMLGDHPKDGHGHQQAVRLKDVISGPPTLAFQLKPKMVVLRVSMHCYGCAKKVEKHISKMEGVTSYQVDLETKMVVVVGDIVPFEVLESVSKVKNAELWTITTQENMKVII
ncbi:PREDICTED: heavy metal-associated isoprenylated plant protein 35-like [Ipomoea nil]|uniref:heavy metal-associated isoprenylated plant protein 35-like n=1 Tax=Ipomoea nil TaxID=35883 RepID=UPI000901FD67|nr:PREDICTED: heavy metal-associated isoprenylated plant protein 35-like [Ipomoea nil]